MAYYSKGDYDSAIADYAAAIRLAPNYAAALNNRGLAYVLKENYEAAIADCTEAIRLDPKAANPHRHRAAAFVGKGDFDRALTDVEEAIRLNPKYALAYATRGVVFEKKGDLTRALADFNQALALQSDLSDAIAGRDRIRATVVATAPTTTPTTLAASPAREAPSTSLPVASPPAKAPEPTLAPAFVPLGRRVALIVANHAYPIAPLANPPIDAEMIKTSLEKIGFSVVVKNDLDLDAFEQALADFAEASKGADVALFYFAGHGFSIAAGGRQQNLLMSTSANFAAKTAIGLEGGGEPLGTYRGDDHRPRPSDADLHRRVPQCPDAREPRRRLARFRADRFVEFRGRLRRAVDAPGQDGRGRPRRPGQPVRAGVRDGPADARLAHRGRL